MGWIPDFWLPSNREFWGFVKNSYLCQPTFSPLNQGNQWFFKALIIRETIFLRGGTIGGRFYLGTLERLMVWHQQGLWDNESCAVPRWVVRLLARLEANSWKTKKITLGWTRLDDGLITWYGCFLQWWYPQNTPIWSLLVGKHRKTYGCWVPPF